MDQKTLACLICKTHKPTGHRSMLMSPSHPNGGMGKNISCKFLFLSTKAIASTNWPFSFNDTQGGIMSDLNTHPAPQSTGTNQSTEKSNPPELSQRPTQQAKDLPDLGPVDGFTTQQLLTGIHLAGALSSLVFFADLWLGIPALLFAKKDKEIVRQHFFALENFLWPLRIFSLILSVIGWISFEGFFYQFLNKADLSWETDHSIRLRFEMIARVLGFVPLIVTLLVALCCLIQARNAWEGKAARYPFGGMRLFERILKTIGLSI